MAEDSFRDLVLAVQYWHSARIISENEPRQHLLNDPICFMLTHSMELILKRYLREKLSPKRFSSFSHSHNLKDLLKEAVSEGLRITPIQASCVLAMEKAHQAPYTFRYGLKNETRTYQSARIDLALLATAHLIDQISRNPLALRSAYGPRGESNFEYPAAPAIENAVDVNFLNVMIAENDQHALEFEKKHSSA